MLQPVNQSNNSSAFSTAQNKWSLAIRLLHWGGLLFIFLAWAFYVAHEQFDDELTSTYIDLHKSIGVVTFVWMLIHAVTYTFSKKPPYTHVIMTDWQKVLAKLVHVLLLLLLIAMPLAGMLMTQYAGRTVTFFGLFNMPTFVNPNQDNARFWHGLHTGLLWSAITTMIGIHVAAVIYHMVIKKDNIIKRMR